MSFTVLASGAGQVADQLAADLLVALLVASPWLAAVIAGAAVGAGAAWLVQSRRRGGVRDQRSRAAGLAEADTARLEQLTEAHAGRRRAEERALAYQRRASWAQSRAADLADDVHDLQLALARAAARAGTGTEPDLRRPVQPRLDLNGRRAQSMEVSP